MTVWRRGAFLTPQEMEELTAPWRPYRSLGKPCPLLRPTTDDSNVLTGLGLVTRGVLHVGVGGGSGGEVGVGAVLDRYPDV